MMRRSPFSISERLKDTLCTYLETAYRISNQTIVDERAQLLRERAVVSQTPFVETTPLFEQTTLLRDLKLPAIPRELVELAGIGLSVGKRPLYRHQEEALRAAWDEAGTRPRDLLVASGTGSGKTEIFYLTILADILREAIDWESPQKPQEDMGMWTARGWQHRRRFETRPAAVRAIVLYPMNALVNDQLRRLRRLLASDEAIEWQKNTLNENLMYFGMYTSQTMLPGDPSVSGKRKEWRTYLNDIFTTWNSFDSKLRSLGNWPRPNGPEMICRWNMQAAPPDILLTNYSMLEYMLVRPIEAPIFSATKDWLAQSPEHILTLVLDEAHTYSGARGTEVAYLIRRLYERLGVGEEQVRCIATSASLGSKPEEIERGRMFAASLFAHTFERFTPVQAAVKRSPGVVPAPTLVELDAFARFQTRLETDSTDQDETLAVDELLSALQIESIGTGHIERLNHGLEKHPRIQVLRDLTARNAMELGEVASKLWGNLGTSEQRERATAGILAAGAIARPVSDSLAEVSPLLPSRLHLMFRGLPGLWACIDPECSTLQEHERNPGRPCGRIYAEPRLWCDCGARVVELLSCRVCGLLVGGGIEEHNTSTRRIWPYEDNLEGGVGQYDLYTIFALENPNPTGRGQHEWVQVLRNVKSTAIENNPGQDVRLVWEPRRDQVKDTPPIHMPCPRCGQRRSYASGRNPIEPLRTTGTQAFGVLMEDAFRLQGARLQSCKEDEPEQDLDDGYDWFTDNSEPSPGRPPKHCNPNRGRKALAFSDSRQNAARLAGDLVYLHNRDLFRQLMLHVLDQEESATPISVKSLIDRMLERGIELGIDPTFGEYEGFWRQWDVDRTAPKNAATDYLETYLRREIADRQVGVEALGLARWIIQGLEGRKEIPAITPFSQEQSLALLYSALRILASENVIVPHSLDPEDWPSELVERYYRRVISLGGRSDGGFSWSPSSNNRLTRYFKAILEAGGYPTSDLDTTMEALWKIFQKGRIARPVSGRRQGYGIPIARFALAQMPSRVFVCDECKYISAEAVHGVCLRCHQHSTQIERDEVYTRRNDYYRRLAMFTQGEQDFPDPFPLRVKEHTAQISSSKAADRERWFQDQYLPDEDALEVGVDILSVTTTMEMGIDIGDLTVVGLHNTPPTVANYQQRAGRAGRRSDGIAEVITFSRHRSHDQYYYQRVADIVTGAVRIPTLHLGNRVIAQRHVAALILQRFFADQRYGNADTTLFEAFGSVAGFLENDGLRQKRLQEFVSISGQRPKIEKAVSDLIAASGIDLLEAMDWVDQLPAKLGELCEQAIGTTELLNLLIDKGVLPRYAFPVDVVALWTEPPSRWNRGDEVQRDLSIALSEYAPGSEIIIDGQVHQSIGLFAPFDKQPDYSPSGWYYECPQCHHVRFAERQGSNDRPAWETCPMCDSRVGASVLHPIFPVIEPPGFRTDWSSQGRKYRGGGQDRVGYASPAQLVAGETSWSGTPECDGRLYIYQRTGDLYTVNRGSSDEDRRGFAICSTCGLDLQGNPNKPHKNPLTGRDCRSSRHNERAILLHQFNSDIVLLGVSLTQALNGDPRTPGGRAAWLSLGTALRQGAAAYLQIDPEELAMGIRPSRNPVTNRLLAEVYLYDTLPNGAGYAKEIAADINSILERAATIVENCPEACETACYRCLLEYGNQPYHGLIDRHLARDIIDYVLNGTEPELSPDSAASALERLRPYARQFELAIDPLQGGTGRLTGADSARILRLIPIHALRSYDQIQAEMVRRLGLHPVFISYFDLTRRPFWVWDQLLPILDGRSDAVQGAGLAN